jgi:isopenicillin N synthase-like dioxygenase
MVYAPNSSGAFVVNGGQLLQCWTNDYFLATPQPLGRRALNSSPARDSICWRKDPFLHCRA